MECDCNGIHWNEITRCDQSECVKRLQRFEEWTLERTPGPNWFPVEMRYERNNVISLMNYQTFLAVSSNGMKTILLWMSEKQTCANCQESNVLFCSKFKILTVRGWEIAWSFLFSPVECPSARSQWVRGKASEAYFKKIKCLKDWILVAMFLEAAVCLRSSVWKE